ncbi:MAG: PAS domain-containing protein [candidate division Zixibacteria bacterium]|nr:PAS domain-containing protein [candidate division Zixibacteria bacterium]
MIPVATDCITGFTRCAVCKIDLKGRFVYIDDEVERLLGYSKEELFGRSLVDFLAGSSQEPINQLLAHRNHYEAFYDTTRVVLVSRNRQTIPVSLIVSLNFIAGNPVNFQLIINRSESSVTADGAVTGDRWDVDFLQNLLAVEDFTSWPEHLRLLREYAGAKQICVYSINGDALQPRSAISDDPMEEFASTSIPETTALHRRVAQSGVEYAFTDGVQDETAAEPGGTAPGEYVARVNLPEDNAYLVRFLFEGEPDGTPRADAVSRARFGLNCTVRLMTGTMTAGGDDQAACDVKFTIGYLDSLGIGGLLIQADGQISGYNATLLKLVDREEIEGTYMDFARLLAEHNDPSIETRLENHFRTVGEEDCFADLHLDLKLPGGKAARMVAVRFAYDAGDLSAGIALIPQSAVPQPGSSPGIMDNQRWLSVISSFGSELKKVNTIAERLANEFYNEMGKEGNSLLENLDSSARSLRNMLDEIGVMLRLMNDKSRPERIDLKLLTQNAIRQAMADCPGATVECRCEDLPKVVTSSKIAAKILYSAVICFIRLSRNAAKTIVVHSEFDGCSCRIIVSGDELDYPEKSLKKLFHFFGQVPDGSGLPASGDGTSLAVTRQLASGLGWQIDLTSIPGERTAIAISVPCGDPPAAASV